jgi:hypothetical protein
LAACPPITPASNAAVTIIAHFMVLSVSCQKPSSFSSPAKLGRFEMLRNCKGTACVRPAFRTRYVGHFKSGAITHRVTLDSEGRLVLKPDWQAAYRLAPEQGGRFRIVELEGFVVEFRGVLF